MIITYVFVYESPSEALTPLVWRQGEYLACKKVLLQQFPKVHCWNTRSITRSNIEKITQIESNISTISKVFIFVYESILLFNIISY